MSLSDQDRVRVAVIGCGAISALHHLPVLARSRRAEVSLLVDADRARAQALADRYAVPAVAIEAAAAAEHAEVAIVAFVIVSGICANPARTSPRRGTRSGPPRTGPCAT